MAQYNVGDKVKVFDINGHRHGQPEGGWDGEIVKVGRTLFTARWNGRSAQFYQHGGCIKDNRGHHVALLVPQARLKVALDAIRSRGFVPAEYARHDIDYLEAVAQALRGLPNPRL